MATKPAPAKAAPAAPAEQASSCFGVAFDANVPECKKCDVKAKCQAQMNGTQAAPAAPSKPAAPAKAAPAAPAKAAPAAKAPAAPAKPAAPAPAKPAAPAAKAPAKPAAPAAKAPVAPAKPAAPAAKPAAKPTPAPAGKAAKPAAGGGFDWKPVANETVFQLAEANGIDLSKYDGNDSIKRMRGIMALKAANITP